jgi:PAS domain S-box-containing protein
VEFPAELRVVQTLRQYREAIVAERPDIALLDLHLPDGQAESVLVSPPEDGEFPLVTLTNREDELAGVRSLDAGALDYIVKSPEAFTAMYGRVRRVLREWNSRTERKRAEEQLQLLKRSIDSHPDGAYWMDDENKMVYVNDAGCRALGFAREELIGKPLSYVNPDATGEIMQVVWEMLRRDGFFFAPEAIHRRQDGSELPVEVMTSYVQLDGREYYCGFARDITARREAERRQRVALEVMDVLNQSETSPWAIQAILSILRRGTDFEAVGIRLRDGTQFPRFVQWGFPETYLQGEDCLDSSGPHGTAPSAHGCRLGRQCICGEVLSGEGDLDSRWYTPGGSFWCNDIAHGLPTPDAVRSPGNRCAEAGFRSMALVPIRADGQVVGLLQLNDRRPDRFTLELVQYFEGISRCMGIALARMQDAEALAKAQATAETANRLKSEFLANMSHEIRTPMTAIVGLSELLDGPEVTPAKRLQWLQLIRSNGQALLRLINDILDLSRIEADRLPVEKRECSLTLLVDEVLDVERLRAAEKGISMRLCYAYPLPRTICTDPVRLRQILVNLVGNAVKFTSRGEVAVTVESLPPGNCIQFTITDTGIGIPPDKLNEIFQPFVQVDGTSTRRHGGTGLGLTISRRLARALGGDIQVSSLLGRGSVFTFAIANTRPPAAENAPTVVGYSRAAGEHTAEPTHTTSSDAQPAAAASEARPQSGPIPAHPPTGRGRVLLVEDEMGIQLLMQHILRQLDLEVEVVSDGKSGCELAERSLAEGRPFDLILMDIQLPVMNGYDATRRLRDRGWRGPILALTARTMSGDREKCLAAGCDDHVSKPISIAAFRDLVQRHIPRGVATSCGVPAEQAGLFTS